MLNRLVRYGGVAVLTIALSACAAMQREKTQETERILMAAGFQMRLADTPEKLARLKELPQRQVVPQSHEGLPVFLYADADDCKCLYVGTERAYRRFERISLIKGFQAERLEAVQAREATAMDLRAWGPWAPWW